MGFSQEKFLVLPATARCKKLSDLLRVILLQLGSDWKQSLAEYDRLVAWHLPDNSGADFRLGSNLQHSRVLDLYEHWRQLAGLGAQRDVYLQPDPGDRETPMATPLSWNILLHNLRSAYNVGSIIRTVDCFGLGTVHLSGYTPDLHHPSLRSAARGSEHWIPTQRWDSPISCIDHFQRIGSPIVALETGDDAKRMNVFSWPSTGLLILGNEELGIAPELLEKCDHKVFIAMYGRKASMNVASAFAVASCSIRTSIEIAPK